MSRTSEAGAICAPFLLLATIVVILRLYTRLRILKNAGTEDLFVALSWVSQCYYYIFQV